MGFFDRFGSRIRTPLDGTAQVVSATLPPDGHGSAACGLHLVVHLPGLPARAVEVTKIVKQSKWPYAGQVLPVTADRDDPSRLTVRWDQVPTHRQRQAERAAELARSLNEQDRPQGP